MRYFVENTLENLTLIRAISDGFSHRETDKLFSQFKHYNTIFLTTEEYGAPQFMFRDTTEEMFLSEAELRDLVFTLSLEQ